MASQVRCWFVFVLIAVWLGGPGIVPSGLRAASSGQPVHAQGMIHQHAAHVRCSKRNRASGTLKVMAATQLVSASPYTAPNNVFLPDAMFDDLFRYDDKARLFPMMATEIPTLRNGGIKDGGKTIIIHLKPGLRWSNGAEITSADLRFGWQISMDPASGCGSFCNGIMRIDTPDRYTAVLRLKRADPSLISPGTTFNFSGPMPNLWPTQWPHAWNNNPHAAALKLFKDPSFNFEGPNFPTDGPYQVVQHIAGVRTVLRPMKYYDDMTCGGYIANIIAVAWKSWAGVVAAAADRQVDITLGDEYLPQLADHAGPYALHVDPTFTLEHVIFNVDRTYYDQPNPLADTRVRQALALAVDKSRVIRDRLSVSSSFVKNLVAWTPWIITPRLVAPFADRKIVGQWDPLAQRFLTDTGGGTALTDARRLLASTPWKHGFTLDFLMTADELPRRVEERDIAAAWARLGIKVNLVSVPFPHIFDDWDHGGPVNHGAFQAALFADGGSPDPDGWRFDFQSQYIDREQAVHSFFNSNSSGIHDSVFDRAFDIAGRSYNARVRAANYAAIQKELDQKAYWICLAFRPFISTVDRRVLNFTHSPFEYGEDWNTYEWKVR